LVVLRDRAPHTVSGLFDGYIEGASGMRSVSQPLISVCGGTGYIGRHLIRYLADHGIAVRSLQRPNARLDAVAPDAGVAVFTGDVFDASSLSPFLENASCLVNLAWSAQIEEDPQGYASHVAKACIDSGLPRLIHVSTATVVGRPSGVYVDEHTLPRPRTRYERAKLAVEHELQRMLGQKLDFAIVRPTAVFGPGSDNLRAQARRLVEWPQWARHVMRFLYGRRRMHLVPVEDVVAVLFALATARHALGGRCFIVSADGRPDNAYQCVDEVLGTALGLEPRMSNVQLPPALLSWALRMAGRSQNDPRLIFQATPLEEFDCPLPSDFRAAVSEYGRWYRDRRNDPHDRSIEDTSGL
jgi:nucleoside-diphosphate-sugar epimerase